MSSIINPVAPATRWLSAAEQRKAFEDVADLIEKHYVFPPVANVCAGGLRHRPVRPGGVSSTTLARDLTAQLRVHDRHFAVTWGAPAPLTPVADRQTVDAAMSLHMVEGIGVLTIRRFDDVKAVDVARLARDSVAQLECCEAAVIDVRHNPGGWPSMVEYLLSAFLGPDPVHLLTFIRRGAPDLTIWTRPPRRSTKLSEIPVVVIVDERTASAAENLAYTLQTTGRGVIVGRQTAGAANPVESFARSSGFHVYIPTGAPIDPRTGTNWDHIGVRPDIVLQDGDDAGERALDIARPALP